MGTAVYRSIMEIRIGIVQSMKELEIDLGTESNIDQVTKDVEEALAGDTVLWLTDRKGRRVGVPSSRIAYVDLGSPTGDRVVGFGAA
jgi:DNA-binding transcriptional regulator/RsmH inhibitor MraZ